MKKTLLILGIFSISVGFTMLFKHHQVSESNKEQRIPPPPLKRFSQMTKPNEIAQFLKVSSGQMDQPLSAHKKN